MKPRFTGPADPARRAQLQSELRRDIAARQEGYRERALKLFPHVCASCGRGFDGKRLKELTVHHKDHNHNNNPPDGSNWELLCLYCHDHEHEKHKLEGCYEGAQAASEQLAPSIFSPFENLGALFGAPPEDGPEKSPENG